jgi:hypothetical protein
MLLDTKTSDLTTSVGRPPERVQAAWPGEGDFDLAVGRFLNQGLDAPSPSRSD